LTTFGLLWILYTPYREIYVPSGADIPALADGVLLGPGARWQDWFTRGYSHFWDLYPEWPPNDTGFTRPAFQLLIYLVHFALGKDWASYQLINCFAAAGMAAIAFQIARTVLGLQIGPSLVTALLVVLSPPVLTSWLFGPAFAIEPLATVLVAGAFLAAFARHDLFCLALLFLALSTKENTVWAPLAAAITIMLRPKPDELLCRRAVTAAAMFLPVVVWLGLRFVFFNGIGGTYVTADYAPLVDFLKLTFHKLSHIHYLFITQRENPLDQRMKLVDWGAALLIYALLSLWALRILPEALNRVRYAIHERRWPTGDAVFLVSVWAAIALAFHFALPLSSERYATSVVVFAWPALVAEVEKHRKTIIWFILAICCVVSVTESSYRFIEWVATPLQNAYRAQGRAMGAVLRQVRTGTQQIYVLSAGGLQSANPEYLRLVLDVPAEIVRVADIDWDCGQSSDLVAFDHTRTDGVVNIAVRLPACARLYFSYSNGLSGVADGRLYRNDTISYELPRGVSDWAPRGVAAAAGINLGRRMTVHVRPNGPARFIIEHGAPNGIAWFDTP
jgi:hypothetical protein